MLVLLRGYTSMQMGARHFQILGYIAATSDHISSLAGQCSHWGHMDFRGKRLPDGSYVSALTAEYPSALPSAIVNIISPWVSQSSLMNQDLSTWRNLLSRNQITRSPPIADRAGDNSSANWTIPKSKDFVKSLRQTWIKRSLETKLHTKIRLQLLHSLLLISEDPDTKIATLLQEGIPSGAFSQLHPVGLWEPNSKTSAEYPDLIVANHDPAVTRQLIQKELDDGFITWHQNSWTEMA